MQVSHYAVRLLMLRTCPRIIALAVILVGLPTAQAADTTLMLACQGTKTYISMADGTRDQEGQPTAISMGIIVNLTAQTVTGLDDEPPLTIRSVNETIIAFGRFECSGIWMFRSPLQRPLQR
jgi:hypothetical protein